MTSSTEQLARSIVQAAVRRAARAEAVGILRSWQGCDTAEAQRALIADGGVRGQDAAAARVTAAVDALATSDADPDWDD